MAGLDQPLGRPVPQLVEGRAAGAVDAGQPEHRRAETQPVPLRRRPPRALDRMGPQLAGLEHPAAAPVAIDPGGGQIADPRRRGGGEGRGQGREALDSSSAVGGAAISTASAPS